MVRRVLVCVLFAGLAAPASGQRGLAIQGIVDGELWSTDSLSNLLTRNEGRPGLVGRAVVWGAAEPIRRVYLYASVLAERGSGRAAAASTDVELEQLAIRVQRSTALVVDVGKMTSSIGAFAPRRFSSRNPLIGVPDGYPVQYPIGAVASGTIRQVDYRAGVMSLPVAHRGYVPDPTPAPRPAIGGGVTPLVGVRFGFSATAGPYLNDDLDAGRLDGRPWKAYKQRVIALDVHASRGHGELRAEWARSRYEVPEHQRPVHGTTYYVEGTYALTPRLFAAARHELNKYPFIRLGAGGWAARTTQFRDTEVGFGLRLARATTLKTTLRRDRWTVTDENSGFIRPGGRALAVQLSHTFDISAMLERE